MTPEQLAAMAAEAARDGTPLSAMLSVLDEDEIEYDLESFSSAYKNALPLTGDELKGMAQEAARDGISLNDLKGALDEDNIKYDADELQRFYETPETVGDTLREAPSNVLPSLGQMVKDIGTLGIGFGRIALESIPGVGELFQGDGSVSDLTAKVLSGIGREIITGDSEDIQEAQRAIEAAIEAGIDAETIGILEDDIRRMREQENPLLTAFADEFAYFHDTDELKRKIANEPAQIVSDIAGIVGAFFTGGGSALATRAPRLANVLSKIGKGTDYLDPLGVINPAGERLARTDWVRKRAESIVDTMKDITGDSTRILMEPRPGGGFDTTEIDQRATGEMVLGVDSQGQREIQEARTAIGLAGDAQGNWGADNVPIEGTGSRAGDLARSQEIEINPDRLPAGVKAPETQEFEAKVAGATEERDRLISDQYAEAQEAADEWRKAYPSRAEQRDITDGMGFREEVIDPIEGESVRVITLSPENMAKQVLDEYSRLRDAPRPANIPETDISRSLENTVGGAVCC